MDSYDADTAPDPDAWLALDETVRQALVLRHHHGRTERTLHTPGYRREMHASLHVVVENQIAGGEPAVTGETVARLCEQGLRRHVALHVVIEALIRTMSEAMAQGRPTDPEQWARTLRALDAGDWLGDRMRKDLGAPE